MDSLLSRSERALVFNGDAPLSDAKDSVDDEVDIVFDDFDVDTNEDGANGERCCVDELLQRSEADGRLEIGFRRLPIDISEPAAVLVAVNPAIVGVETIVGVEDADEEGDEVIRDSLLPDRVIKHAESISACIRFLERVTGDVTGTGIESGIMFEDGNVESVPEVPI
ncbi:hypothetical protein BGX27_009289 [Mortierella sp. AM989]|nr:hypothetical protein BGX27_009289 [Mortierella sp. AM989]